MATHDELFGVIVFFLVLTTFTVGLRVFVRTKLGGKGAFWWDDGFLIVSWIGYVLFCLSASQAVYYGGASDDSQPWHDKEKGIAYNLAMNDVCYFISTTVKISVALVLYRLVELINRTIRWLLIIDIVGCVLYNLATTLVLALGCMEGTPYTFSTPICQNANYASEASYIIWNTFHVVLPVFILRDLKISRKVKAGVIFLFGIGLVAVFATIMRLTSYVEEFKPIPTVSDSTIWYTRVTWTASEHGLSIFASSILALTPVVKILASSWKSMTSRLGSGNKSFGDWTTTGKGSSGGGGGAELPSISVRKDISVGSETREDGASLHGPMYVAEVNGSRESQRDLMNVGLRACSEAGNVV